MTKNRDLMRRLAMLRPLLARKAAVAPRAAGTAAGAAATDSHGETYAAALAMLDGLLGRLA